MIARGIAPNVKSAKNMLDRRPPEVFDILEEITKDHPVLLNRAPTLHKLSIQAFYPVLLKEVQSGFTRQFVQDLMLILMETRWQFTFRFQTKAIEEARTLMLPTNNLLKPATVAQQQHLPARKLHLVLTI